MSAEVKELLPICENLDSAQNLQDKGEPTPAAAAAAVAAAAAAVAAAAKPQQRSKGHRGNHQQAKNQSSLLAATGAKSQIQSKATTLAFNPCKRRIAKDEISKLPLIAWEGPVKVLSTVPEMEAAVSKLLQQNVTHLGFDTESRPAFRKGSYYPPALIQLAAPDCVYLFRISTINHKLEPLLPILESAAIIKTGVAIQEDVKELVNMKAPKFKPAGFLDITTVTKEKLKYMDTGLRPLTALFMSHRIAKGRVQTSNWACESPLTLTQVKYAATDAWVGREVYIRACQQAGLAPDGNTPGSEPPVASVKRLLKDAAYNDAVDHSKKHKADDTSNADASDPKRRISKEEIGKLPLVVWEGPVQVLSTVEEMQVAVGQLLKDKVTQLGFKTKCIPPALVQLAAPDCVYLFRISKIGHKLHPLLPILESSDIIKVGVGIQKDLFDLLCIKATTFKPAGFQDITTVTRDILQYQDCGLRPLAALFMAGRITNTKPANDWAREASLATTQVKYAATDAWVSREVFVRAQAQAGLPV